MFTNSLKKLSTVSYLDSLKKPKSSSVRHPRVHKFVRVFLASPCLCIRNTILVHSKPPCKTVEARSSAAHARMRSTHYPWALSRADGAPNRLTPMETCLGCSATRASSLCGNATRASVMELRHSILSTPMAAVKLSSQSSKLSTLRDCPGPNRMRCAIFTSRRCAVVFRGVCNRALHPRTTMCTKHRAVIRTSW